MSTASWSSIDEIFRAASDVPEAQRADYIRSRCPDDPDLVREVLSLLAHAADDSFLAVSALGQRVQADALLGIVNDDGSPSPGEQIGQYHVVRLLARGGMSTVYEARQSSPDRSVAMKFPRSNVLASRSAVRRFRDEGQILARLRHPNIASIYEVGVYTPPNGEPRPYLVMELIPDAVPITALSRRHDLTRAELLQIFVQAAGAVQHGHQHGIIHRDLKPSNILIDTHLQAKIIDFGIAKASSDDASGATACTSAVEWLGTVQYMSPEQFNRLGGLLDVRTDVYSLGIVLYELLTGRQPFDLATLTPIQAARVVCELPVPPPELHNPDLRGDLSTIVLTALERDISRRYPSVADFINDLQRFARSLPIQARRPTLWYRTSLLVRRHRRTAAAACVGAAVLLATGVQTYRSSRDARTERQTAHAVLSLITDMLASPNIRGRQDARVVDMLDYTSRALEAGAGLRPAAREQMHTTLGRTYDHLGFYMSARRQFEAALPLARTLHGPTSERARQATINLEGSCFDLGDYGRALALLDSIFPLTSERFGRDSLECADLLNEYGLIFLALGHPQRAEQSHREALGIRRLLLGEQHPKYAQSLHNLGAVMLQEHRYAEAEESVRQAIAVLSSDPSTNIVTIARHQRTLAEVLLATGRLDEAQRIGELALHALHDSVGSEHAFTARIYRTLAALARARGEHDAEIRSLRFAYDRYVKACGEAHPETQLTIRELRAYGVPVYSSRSDQ